MSTHLELLSKSIVSIHKGKSKQKRLETYIERLETALCQEFDDSEIKKIQDILIQLRPNEKKPKTTSGYDLFRKQQCATLKGDCGNHFKQLACEWKALSQEAQDVWRTKAIESVASANDICRENQPEIGNVDQPIADID